MRHFPSAIQRASVIHSSPAPPTRRQEGSPVKPFRSLPVLALLIMLSSRASSSELTLISDNTWEAFDTDPTPSTPSLGPAQYVCLAVGCPSSCPTGAVLYGYGCGYWGAQLTPISGAHWIWKPSAPSDPADLAVACFAKTITINGSVVAATFYLAADDFAEVRVNGELAGSVGSITDYGSAAGAQGVLVGFDLAPFLGPGPNQIVVCSQNGPNSFTGLSCAPCSYSQNPAGVVFGGTILTNDVTRSHRPSWGILKAWYR